MNPTIVLAMVAGLAGCLVVEWAGARRRVARGPTAVLAALPGRTACLAILWLGWLGVFGRPLMAIVATVITVAVLTAISVKKRRLVGEPLVFSDFGLLRLVLRHPDLYYTDALARPPALAGFAAAILAIAAWIWLEPPLLGAAGAAGLLALVAALVAFAWWGARTGLVGDALRRLVPEPDLERHVAAWGLLATLVAYALRWRTETALPWPVRRDGPAVDAMPVIDAMAAAPRPPAPDLVVVVQLESFLDLARRTGGEPLPGLAGARARALAHGPLGVPAHGAYTMRSEFAVLSGLSGHDLGFRRFDPFLSVVAAGAPRPDTLAGAFAARGAETLFIRPFRPGFFDRARVVTRLGFGRCLWEDDFAAADRRGPYLGDEALARRILTEAEAMRAPSLIMAVSMENHGPWQAGRLPGETDAVAQYRAHLGGSDRAVALLVDGLSRRPGRALLCVYGDHPPILPSFNAAALPETDYAVVELGLDAPAAAPTSMPLSADALGRLVRRLSGISPAAAPRP